MVQKPKDPIAAMYRRPGFMIRRAHQIARERGFQSSDDGSLVLALAEKVATVPGERTNLKVTFRDDVIIAEAILKRGAA